jgi:PIN domain nuclease of toxin-antitoxin system
VAIMTVLLDASALLAAVNEEPGGQRVAECLDDAAVSAVNLAEVATKLRDFGWQAAELSALVDELQLEVLPFEERDALASAALRKPTRNLGLSLADRACLATAQRTGYPVLTADKAWSRVKLRGVGIEIVR